MYMRTGTVIDVTDDNPKLFLCRSRVRVCVCGGGGGNIRHLEFTSGFIKVSFEILRGLM